MFGLFDILVSACSVWYNYFQSILFLTTVISAVWWYKRILPTKPPPQSTYAEGLREGRRCQARADVALHSGEKHFRWWHFAAATLVSTLLVGVVTGEIEVYRPQVTLEDDASLMQVRVENQLAQPLTLRLAASMKNYYMFVS